MKLFSFLIVAIAVGQVHGAEVGGDVRLFADAHLPSCPGQEFFCIQTPRATYYLEKSGAGLAAMMDRDGVDWIAFSSVVGSRSAGEFRGFPNAVHQPPKGKFHPRNANTEPLVTKVERETSDRITISAVADDGSWAATYDFFRTHCTFTMTKMPAGGKYWVLYEGVPGGKYDDEDWWMTSASPERKPIGTNHEGDIPRPEWIAFGDSKVKRVLFLMHHEDDSLPDRYYPLNRQMTVFGFGRNRMEQLISRVPQRFSIGFLETTDHAEITKALEQILAR